MTGEPRGFSRVVAGFSSYDGELKTIPTCLELFIHLACGGDAGAWTALELNYPRAAQHPCPVCHLGLFASHSIEQEHSFGPLALFSSVQALSHV